MGAMTPHVTLLLLVACFLPCVLAQSSRHAKVLVFDTDKKGCVGKPSAIPSCSKMGKRHELYQCVDNEVMIQKCTDSACKKCGPVIPNPYGYVPNTCQNDYLKVVCTTRVLKASVSSGGGN